MRDVVAAWERLDIVVNNAGIWDEDVAGRGDVEVWDRTYAINLRGAFLVTDAAVPHLEKHGGSIVFVSSTAGQRGEARHSAYAASKGALISYTKSLAAELGPRGIRVNCVAPGWVDTDMSAAALAIRSRAPRSKSRSRSAASRRRRTSLGRSCSWCRTSPGTSRARSLNVNGGSVLRG